MQERSDIFWDVRAREHEEERRLRQDIATIRSQMEVQSRVMALRQAAGFTDFLKSVTALRDASLSKLVNDDRYTDQGIREQRGRVRSLNDMLTLLTVDPVAQTLASQLKEREDLLAEALRRRPQPQQQEAPA